MNKKNHYFKYFFTILIGIFLVLTHINFYIVTASDTIPPELTLIDYLSESADEGGYIYVYCVVYDNLGHNEINDVKVNIDGPNDYSINISMSVDWVVSQNKKAYEYYSEQSYDSGVYSFYIWATDNDGNSVISDTYHIVFLDSLMDYVHVDDSNSEGPWDGTGDHPFQHINDGISAVDDNGTVFIHNGLYQLLNQNIIQIDKKMSLIGEDKENVIIDGSEINGDYVSIISVNVDGVIISNLTIINSNYYGIKVSSVDNIIKNCVIKNCDGYGLYISKSGNNLIYHNNFIDNWYNARIQYDGGSDWDEGVTGNYWDDYQDKYPYATLDPNRGTWNTPYSITGDDMDNHPWVYPNGLIDEQAPGIEVIYPNGGEKLTGDISIQWNAEDNVYPESDLRMLIEYSNDNGNNWDEIIFNIDNTGLYIWDTTKVENGDEYLIRISTVDIFENNGEDVSDSTFTVDNSNPGLEIIAPISVVEGENLDILVYSGENCLESVIVEFNDLTKLTDSEGKVTFTAPTVAYNKEFEISATLEGYAGDRVEITVLNKEEEQKQGWIYGNIYDTSSGNPIQNVQICAILSDEEDKCVFSNEKGQFNIILPAGNYTLKVEKLQYTKSTVSDIIVKSNKATNQNFALEKLEKTNQDMPAGDFSDGSVGIVEYTIQEKASQGKIGAKTFVDKNENIVSYYLEGLIIDYDDSLEESVSFTINRSKSTGTILVFHIGDGVLEDLNNVKLTYDNEYIEECFDASVFFDLQETSDPTWLRVLTVSGLYVFVYVPNFSEHTITISSIVKEAIDFFIATILYISFFAAAAIIFIVIVYLVIFNITRSREKKQ